MQFFEVSAYHGYQAGETGKIVLKRSRRWSCRLTPWSKDHSRLVSDEIFISEN